MQIEFYKNPYEFILESESGSSCIKYFNVKLPDSIKHIKIKVGLFKFDTVLPKKLHHLDLKHNGLVKFDTVLPKRLNYLILSGNNIVKFNTKLPPNLKELDLSYNKLIKLDLHISSKLEQLDVSGNNIKKLKLNIMPGEICYKKIKNNKTFGKKWFYT